MLIPKLANRNRDNICQMGSMRELFTNTWNISFSWLLYMFHFKNLPCTQSHSELYPHSLDIFNIGTRYSWILWKIFVNRNNICQITIFAKKNDIHVIKCWRIGIGIYSWSKYQRIGLWQIYLRTIHELFANRELFAEH